MLKYPQSIYYRRTLKAFSANFVNSLLFSTTLCKLLLTIYYSSLNRSGLKKFLCFTKNFLLSIKIIIQSSLLYFYVYAYVQELFPVSKKKFHTKKYFSYPFVTEHHINLSVVLKLLFNSSVCSQSLVLSIRQQRYLVISSLQVYLF